LGAVYGQNVFLYNPRNHLTDYLNLAGQPNRVADTKHAFLIRADGSILSREHSKGFIGNNFDSSVIHPGDSIVVPEKMIRPEALRIIMDYAQILSSFGIVAAAIHQ
jgi:polysaccharide biosynthesis/export protein